MTIADDIAAGRLRWASEPRAGGTCNEDRIGMTGDAVWVLDGAGTPAGVPACCDRDAAWYVERLDAALSARLGADREAPLPDALAAAIADVQYQHARSCPDPTAGRGPSSTVAIARRAGPWLDLLVLGDSTILIGHDTHTTSLMDTRLVQIAPQLRRDIRTAIAAGHGYLDAEHQRRRAELVHAERLTRNQHGGYWIAADNSAAAAHALTARHRIGSPSPGVRRVVLMTDGAYRATSMFSLYDSDHELLRSLTSEEPESCIRAVRAAEASDPDGTAHPRTKRSDDASLIVWSVASAS